MDNTSDGRPSKIRRLNNDAVFGEGSVLEDSRTEPSASPVGNGFIDDGSVQTSGTQNGNAITIDGLSNRSSESVAAQLATSDTQGLSKSKLKKLRKRAEWEAKRPAWKEKMKGKRVAKRQRKRAEREQLQAAGIAPEPSPKWQKAVQLPVSIMFDCDFESYMNDKENTSLGNQIVRSYSDRRKCRFRPNLVLCSFRGKLKDDFERLRPGYHNWRGIQILDCDFTEAHAKAKEFMCSQEGGQLEGSFTKYEELDREARERLKEGGEVVYLSSEAETDLTELKPYSTYIIGGLVDKNREKGLCFKRATERGMRTARLPIGMFMDISGRKVLATNHVNEIMLKWLECGDWGEAFAQAIPKRRGGKLKGTTATEAAEGDEDAEVDEKTNDDEIELNTDGEGSDEEAAEQGRDGSEDDDGVTIVT